MKHLASTTLCTTFLAATMTVTAAGAGAAPSGPSSVDNAVHALEQAGYNVTIRRTGSGPLRECKVAAIRPGNGITGQRTGAGDPPSAMEAAAYLDVIC